MKFLLPIAVAATLSTGAAHAAPIDLTTLALNGSAALSGPEIVLTESATFLAGSAFTSGVAIDAATAFSAMFEFAITNPAGGGADGLAFVVHGDTDGENALGGAGGGMGYTGITPSIAVEFDTWANGWDPNGNHIGINIDGNLTSSAIGSPGVDMNDLSSMFAWVVYDGGLLEVFFGTSSTMPGTSVASLAYDLNALGPMAYFGFTAATGAAAAKHRVKSFDLTVTTIPVPGALPALAGGIALFGAAGWRRRRR